MPRLLTWRKSRRENDGLSKIGILRDISIMNKNYCSYGSKIIHPTRIRYGEIDASVTHWCTEIAVPIGTVKAVILVKIHHIWNIREVISGTCHIRVSIFDIYAESSSDSWVDPSASRDNKSTQEILAFICMGSLVC